MFQEHFSEFFRILLDEATALTRLVLFKACDLRGSG
jgi:hypothetical protein